jgi:hypothetical protein
LAVQKAETPVDQASLGRTLMIRNALKLSAGILAAACFGCAPPPPPVAPAAAGARSVAASGICTAGDAQSFVNAIGVLSASYDPNLSGAHYKPPSGSSSPFQSASNSNITNDLTNAFSNAPLSFQQYLCGLNGIYISPAACPNSNAYNCNVPSTSEVAFSGAWGFRSRAPNATDLGYRYVAISAALWPSGNAAPLLHDYETQVLQSFPPAGNQSTVSSANPDKTWMSVLAALAHEAGHVRWAERTVPQTGKDYDFDGLIKCPAVDFFIGWNYNHTDPKHPHLRPAKRWRKFADRQNEANSLLDHSMSPYLTDLDTPGTANDARYQLYQAAQPWASLFGAQTPDEDFVETYVMGVLTGYDPGTRTFAGPLTSLALSIPGHTGSPPDVPRDLLAGSKPVFSNKMSCLSF